jgi:hypothetical protein
MSGLFVNKNNDLRHCSCGFSLSCGGCAAGAQGKHQIWEEIDSSDNDVNRSAVAFVVLAVGGMSGFLVGLLLRGQFSTLGFSLLLIFSCSYVGWWARGLR